MGILCVMLYALESCSFPRLWLWQTYGETFLLGSVRRSWLEEIAAGDQTTGRHRKENPNPNSLGPLWFLPWALIDTFIAEAAKINGLLQADILYFIWGFFQLQNCVLFIKNWYELFKIWPWVYTGCVIVASLVCQQIKDKTFLVMMHLRWKEAQGRASACVAPVRGWSLGFAAALRTCLCHCGFPS